VSEQEQARKGARKEARKGVKARKGEARKGGNSLVPGPRGKRYCAKLDK
jgi:hypothetical protein